MHRLLLLCAFLLLATATPARPADAPLPVESTATRFNFAHHLMQSADDARAQGDLRTATILYEEALKEYDTLTKTYPDWDHALSRFRADYCRDQLQDLQRRDRNLKALSSTPQPTASTPPPATNSVEKNSSTPSAPTLEITRRKASELLRQNHAEDARLLLLDALRANPDDAQLRLLIATAQCQLGNFEDALYILEPLVEEHPNAASAQLALGTVYLGLGAPDRALTCVQRAVELDETSHEGHYNLARILLLLNPTNRVDAETHYQRALTLGATPDEDLQRLLIPAPENPDPPLMVPAH